MVLCCRCFVAFQRPPGAGLKGSRRWAAELAALDCRRRNPVPRVSHGCGGPVGSLYLAAAATLLGGLQPCVPRLFSLGCPEYLSTEPQRHRPEALSRTRVLSLSPKAGTRTKGTELN